MNCGSISVRSEARTTREKAFISARSIVRLQVLAHSLAFGKIVSECSSAVCHVKCSHALNHGASVFCGRSLLATA